MTKNTLNGLMILGALFLAIACTKMEPPPTLATTSTGGEKPWACTADIKKFCADVKVGEGRVMKCLAPHEKELTPACKAFRTAQAH